MKQTTDEKLEVAAGEYAQDKRASYGYPTYICLVDAFIAGSKWMQTEQYYHGNEQDTDAMIDAVTNNPDTKKALQEFYNKIGGVK